jgi:hypothetical protein
MNEFMGRVMYPFLFSTSRILTSAGRLTHSSMFLTGMWASSFVRMLNGAVSFGVFCLSLFAAFAFLVLGVAFGRGLPSVLRGELDVATARPLRVVFRSSPFVDLGVGGENRPWSFCSPLATWSATRSNLHLPTCRCAVRSGNNTLENHTHPACRSVSLNPSGCRNAYILYT